MITLKCPVCGMGWGTQLRRAGAKCGDWSQGQRVPCDGVLVRLDGRAVRLAETKRRTCRSCGAVFEATKRNSGNGWRSTCSLSCHVAALTRFIEALQAQRANLQAQLDAQQEAHRG